MLIPIRCVSCNNPLAGKWLKYQELVARKKEEDGLARGAPIPYLTTMTTKTKS